MIRRRNGYRRGLEIAFFSLIITTFVSIPVKAETVDDLKAYLGIAMEKREPTMINVDSGGSDKTTVDSNQSIKNTVDVTNDQLDENLKQLEIDYEAGFKNGLDANSLVDILGIMDYTKGIIKEKETVAGLTEKVDIDKLIEDSKEEEVYREEGDKLGSYNFNIGDVGDMSISPVSKLLAITTPYGYKINDDGSNEAKNNSIDLEAPFGINILAQWNGKIAYIEDDEIENCKVVTIFHGQGLYTVYHHIIEGDIYVGKNVYEGDIIGTSSETYEIEPAKSNHIKYQIILDGQYINPTLIFGNRGQTIYENWLRTSYDKYTVEEGEEFYHKDSIVRDNINSVNNNTQNTIEGAVEVIGNYKRPDPGAIQ